MVNALVSLEDDRVLLRPLQSNDSEWLLPIAAAEPEIWKYSLISAAGDSGMRAYIDAALLDMAAGHSVVFVVFDKQSNQFAGSTRFYDISHQHQTCSIGYTWYTGIAQGSGLNAHCKFLMLNYAFEQWGMARVEFRADARNHRSVAAMKKIGCTEEGVLRSHLTLESGERRTSVVLSILINEWQEHVKARLLHLL